MHTPPTWATTAATSTRPRAGTPTAKALAAARAWARAAAPSRTSPATVTRAATTKSIAQVAMVTKAGGRSWKTTATTVTTACSPAGNPTHEPARRLSPRLPAAAPPRAAARGRRARDREHRRRGTRRHRRQRPGRARAACVRNGPREQHRTHAVGRVRVDAPPADAGRCDPREHPGGVLAGLRREPSAGPARERRRGCGSLAGAGQRLGLHPRSGTAI